MENEKKENMIDLDGETYLLQCETEGDGYILYTKEEWDAEVVADMEADEEGNVTFQGKNTGQKLSKVDMEKARA